MNENGKNITQELYLHAKKRIPGGTNLLSKRPENMCPNQWPAYFSKAKGCEVWDMDDRHYYDMSTNGIGSCALGFADPDVSAAVKARIDNGSMCTLNPAEEVELADKLCEIHPWAEQARFTRCGGESCAVAVRIARATTRRSVIAICGYHGWSDWYLACNLGEEDALSGHLLPGLDPLGVPRELRGTSLTFRFESKEELDKIIAKCGNDLAAVIMEPCRNTDPTPGFLEYVRDSVHKCGGLLIFDEITIGWRYTYGGSHLKLGVNPDIAVFAKALGNGHPIGAIIGTKAAMEGANISFISSTYWTESVGPVAALATLKKMKEVNLSAHIEKMGRLVIGYWNASAKKYNLPVDTSDCYPCLAHFKFAHPQGEALRTLYTQLMLDRGFLAGTGIYPTLAHTEAIMALYGKAIDEVFAIIADALAKDNVKDLLRGPVALSGFKRLI